MPSRRRSRARIVYEILSTLSREGSMPPTRLSYVARMPYDRFAPLLEQLAEKGLVEMYEENGRRRVRITREGLKALRELSAALQVLQKLGLDEY
ncbi:putative transcriptional regulator [Pyrodictium delaneyi]|nr:winged helix-turn-helix domain-containing protein [Pyrodictium delaneyi]ALL00327.1 putative transcriptional regulator [Pyrodictium delaneyi]